MIKSVSLLVRRSGLTHDEFMRHWVDIHAPMSADIPGLRGYVLSDIIAEQDRADIPPLGGPPEIDGIAETWLDSVEARLALVDTPQNRRWWADGAEFIGGIRTFLTEERVIIPVPTAPRPPIKAISFLARRETDSQEAFLHHWQEVHAPMAHEVPGLRGFVLSRILQQQFRSDVDAFALPELDGIAESWIDSVEARAAMIASPAARRWYADGAASIGRIRTLLTREIVVIPPPG